MGEDSFICIPLVPNPDYNPPPGPDNLPFMAGEIFVPNGLVIQGGTGRFSGLKGELWIHPSETNLNDEMEGLYVGHGIIEGYID